MNGSKDFFIGIPNFLSNRSFLVLALYFLGCALYMALVGWVELPFEKVLEVFAFQIILFVTLCVLMVWGYRPCFHWKPRVLGLFLIGFGAYLGLVAIVDYALSFWFPQATAFWPSYPWHELVTGLLLAPVLEEIFFRDYIFRSFLKEGQTLLRAILISSLFFMLAHLSFHLGALALGLINAYLLYRFRVLGVCILIHLGSNALIVVMPFLFPHLNKAMASLGYLNF